MPHESSLAESCQLSLLSNVRAAGPTVERYLGNRGLGITWQPGDYETCTKHVVPTDHPGFASCVFPPEDLWLGSVITLQSLLITAFTFFWPTMNFETWVGVAGHISWLSHGWSSSESKSPVTWKFPGLFKRKRDRNSSEISTLHVADSVHIFFQFNSGGTDRSGVKLCMQPCDFRQVTYLP